MDGWLEFALERYNYWIVIVLMMTGLYTVFARGNLVKKLVGLNLFQTSVFIFYITIGKIAGGSAPIYFGDDLKKMNEGGHGDGGHGEDLHEGADANALEVHDDPSSVHSKIENTFGDLKPNDLKAAVENLPPAEAGEEAAGLHDVPVAGADKISNDALSEIAKPDGAGFEFAPADLHGADGANALGDAAHGVGEIIYTNPLPHVLILTAIVVGVATTAVGLALAVRIREAYGTIEEDELEAINDIAEFGEAAEAQS